MGAPKGGKGNRAPKGKGKGDKGKGKGKDSGDKGKGKGNKQQTKWLEVKGPVLVTGASGFLAGAIIRELTNRGYKVRGTVRSLSNEATCGPLKKNFPKLELHEADLLGGPESFEKACTGCKFVLHTASPFQLSVGDPQKDLVDPALKGTESVVGAAIKAGISRVVVTSSVAAIGPPQSWRSDPSKADPEKVFSEADWNDESTLTSGPYLLSKYLAEKKAWEMVKGTSTELACINPSFILGPMMSSRADGESVRLMKGMLEGTAKLEGYPLGVVDVRDIAKAQVAALEKPEAAGKRFLCSSEIGWDKIDLANLIRDKFKAYPIPTEGKKFGYNPKFCHDQAKEILGFKPRPVEISLRDMANAAIREGIVEKKFVLKAAKFQKVVDINPGSKSVNIRASVVSRGEVEDMKSGGKRCDVVVGDESAVVTLSLVGDELDVAQVGKVVEVRNCQVNMAVKKGYIRMTVGKFGKVAEVADADAITVNKDKDMSSTEYELVA